MTQLLINPMFLVLILFPVITVILSAIAYVRLKKLFVMPLIIFLLSIVFMIMYANETFLFWVIVYLALSILVGLLFKYILSK
ncbi:hypothetical protein BACCIP111899_03771 [Bacillus rhizoplanae]|uniref:DUF2651 domain-containing protein n=1 Tax=Bacillus rhizoplanae TaxID=2880966 RepID=A0ABM8YFB6_9BACI|nr:DUF2651 family protein [Bacillus rhizoplanae]CAG9614538.1 hypothetical protein BACCIP111899_03771 [Bacillus rhizoplanae]